MSYTVQSQTSHLAAPLASDTTELRHAASLNYVQALVVSRITSHGEDDADVTGHGDKT